MRIGTELLKRVLFCSCLKKLLPAAAVLAFGIVSLSGCQPTYPKEELPKAIKNVCMQEYGMDVEVTVKGSTVGIYYPMKGLMDAGMGISEDAWDRIGNLLLIASRVVLSTDAEIKFYCVITQDIKLPELQVVIIKYVDDVKRGFYRNISRSESFKRTLLSINLTPQAKKERTVEKIFEKLGVEEGTRQSILDDFFRSPPTKLSDIGYWRDKFYIKDITLPEFLAAQISSRLKYEFKEDQALADKFKFQNSEGLFVKTSDSFVVKYKIEEKVATEDIYQLRKEKVRTILDTAHDVFSGYKYEDFKMLILIDMLENVQLTVKEQDIYSYEKSAGALNDIVQAPAGFLSQK